MNYLAQRRQSLVRNLKKDGVEALLITGAANVTYLTGFTGDSSFLVVTAKQAVLVSDDRFEAQIREDCAEVGKTGGIDLHVRPHDKTTLEAAAEVLGKVGGRGVGVEGTKLTLADLEALKELAPKLNFVPIPNLVEALRVIKDPSEVEKIRDAVKVAERAYRMFTATLGEFDTEKEMADALENYIRKCGAKCSSFPPIVAVGERGALPHAPPTNRPLADGSKVLIDWGAELACYKSDLTRTIRSPYGTTPSRRNKMERVGHDFEKIYAVVLEAQSAALALVRDGAKAKEVDAAARAVMEAAKIRGSPDLKLADHFTHGLGHGIGLETHEAPRVRANSDDVLEAGMVITIEPGVYIPGWGGVRIEDDVLVTRDGYTLLTTLPRELGPAG
jgi:Xaa-Pro aminopeptidase